MLKDGYGRKIETLRISITDRCNLRCVYCTIDENTILYAQWEPYVYLLIYDGNGENSGSMDPSDKTNGISLTLKINSFTKTNHIFDSWNTKQDGSGVSFADGATNYNIDSPNGNDQYLYAQWDNPGALSGTISYTNSDATFGVAKDYTVDESALTRGTGTIVYNIISAPIAGITIDGPTGLVSFSDTVDVGTYEINIQVSSTNSGTTTTMLNLAVKKATQPAVDAGQDWIGSDKLLSTSPNFVQQATGGRADGSFVYTSSTPSVASVDSTTGEVDIRGVGLATITVSKPGGANFFDISSSYDIEVVSARNTTNLISNPTSPSTQTISLIAGNEYQARIGNNDTGLEFDGVDDYMSFSNTSNLAFGTGAFTIAFKMKANALLNDKFLIGARKAIGNLVITTGGYNSTIGVLRYVGSSTILSTTVVADGSETEHHIIITRDTNSNVKLYVDNVLEATGTDTRNYSRTTGTWYVGRNDGSVKNLYSGILANINFFNAEISSADRATLKNGGIVTTNLIARYLLNETTGTTAVDSSGNGNDGTLAGGLVFTGGSVDLTATIIGTINDLQLEDVTSFTDKKPSHFIDGNGNVGVVNSVDGSGVITE